MADILIGDRRIGPDRPTYFIAEIGANHDGDLDRARGLIHLAKDAGAEAAKFQNFTAAEIVTDVERQEPGARKSHQAGWQKSVFEMYQSVETPAEWTPLLAEECRRAGLHYFSSPYDRAAVELLAPHVPAYKLGSGDITWLEQIAAIAGRGKPVLLATGASTIGEVQEAVRAALAVNPQLAVLQCNTNYTGQRENFGHAHLRVLTAYAALFPEVVLGFSDHTPGHAAVLGAVALGARIIEKHFTDDPSRPGSDHQVAMSPAAFRAMVDRTRELELALGAADKFVADNERDTVLIQRRCLRAARDIRAGEPFSREMIAVLRPMEAGAIPPSAITTVIGATAAAAIPRGAALHWTALAPG